MAIIIETRRSKGVHKADLTKFTKEEVKEVLSYFNSNSYVAVMNYRIQARELKFHLVKEKGLVNYCLKTILSESDLKDLGFSKTEKNNWHLTQEGCTVDSVYDIEVKEPVKKVESKKTKAEKKEKAKAETTSSKKKPLPAPVKTSKVEEEDLTETVSA